MIFFTHILYLKNGVYYQVAWISSKFSIRGGAVFLASKISRLEGENRASNDLALGRHLHLDFRGVFSWAY